MEKGCRNLFWPAEGALTLDHQSPPGAFLGLYSICDWSVKLGSATDDLEQD